MKNPLYHTAVLLLSLFSLLGRPTADALEQKKVTDVWPIGQRQQYLYYLNGKLAGESWMEIREMPKTGGKRLEMINTIDVDGHPFGAAMKVKGQSVAEINQLGRPVSYDLDLTRPDGVTTMEVLFAYPDAQMHIISPKGERDEEARYHAESVIIDFIFIGPFDLAFRLDPVNPSATTVKRNYFVPQLEVNVYSDLYIEKEETVVMEDGTEQLAVHVRLPFVLTEVWQAPDGRIVKAVVPSEALEIRMGKTETP